MLWGYVLQRVFALHKKSLKQTNAFHPIKPHKKIISIFALGFPQRHFNFVSQKSTVYKAINHKIRSQSGNEEVPFQSTAEPLA